MGDSSLIADAQDDDTLLSNELLASVPDIQVAFAGSPSYLTASYLNMIAGPYVSMDIKTIVVWQVAVAPSLVALAQSLGLNIFVADDLSTLADDVQQAVLALPGGVLDNDTDADSNRLTAQLATPPANGTLTFNSNGSFQYTPNTGFSGMDTFTYTATDGNATSARATVTITVTSTMLPIANPDEYQAAQDRQLFINAFNNEKIAVFSDTLADAAIMANALSGLGPNVQVIVQDDASDYNADYINWLAGPGAYLGVNTLVVWQLPFDQSLVPIAQCLAMQIINSDDLPTLVGYIQQISMQPGGLLVNDVSPDGEPLSTQEVTPPATATCSSCRTAPSATCRTRASGVRIPSPTGTLKHMTTPTPRRPR